MAYVKCLLWKLNNSYIYFFLSAYYLEANNSTEKLRKNLHQVAKNKVNKTSDQS